MSDILKVLHVVQSSRLHCWKLNYYIKVYFLLWEFLLLYSFIPFHCTKWAIIELPRISSDMTEIIITAKTPITTYTIVLNIYFYQPTAPQKICCNYPFIKYYSEHFFFWVKYSGAKPPCNRSSLSSKALWFSCPELK